MGEEGGVRCLVAHVLHVGGGGFGCGVVLERGGWGRGEMGEVLGLVWGR